MIKSNKQWVVHQPEEQLVKQFQQQLNISTIAAKVLVARGCETIEQAQKLLQTDESSLHDPFLLHGMQEAVDRIEEAIFEEQRILVYGDYDSDGITSTTIMMNVLLDLGATVDYMIPNRFTHGYGPNIELFEQAAANGVQLIITVDNGISGIEPIRRAKELGIDVIVTDHHEPGPELPNADVIIHPRVPENHYPFGELAGVGVAFKLAHALYGEVPDHLYEYVAVGTIADLVPLVDENRYLVKKGIESLKRSRNPWVRAMCDVSGAEQASINEETIGFYFAPRLNAVGRLGDASPGVQLLMSETGADAQLLAKALNDKNSERKQIVNDIFEQAVAQIESNDILRESKVLIIGQEGWNAGVVGIVASRLVEKYYKPTFVLSFDRAKGIAKGSARSIDGFHLYNEIAKNRDLVPHFGGHPMAAGMTLPLENVELLRENLHKQAIETMTDEQFVQKLQIDVPLDISEITVEAIEELAILSPFGTEFSKPVFAVQHVAVQNMRKIGAGENHLKMELSTPYGSIDAIGFGKGYLFNEISYDVQASFVGDLQINEWQGNKKPQFMIQDVQVNEWQLFDLRGKSQSANWLSKIPTTNVSFVAFDEQTIELYKNVIPQPILYINEAQAFSSITLNIVILDLPRDTTLLEQLLQQQPFERIYAHLHTPNSQYFNGMPTREHFSWYYGFLKKRPAFNLNMHKAQLSQHIGLNTDVINFMTNVFFELGFVTIENGLTTVVENAPKKALETAPSYIKRAHQIELEQKLLYATYIQLKQWFNERMMR
ncbi:MAG: single-stranded-DNA-specific exonuclease RecJ [Lysinibacillus sp.]